MGADSLSGARPASIFERPLRVAVLLGGVSREREVSLLSGRGVVAALAERGHRVVPVDVSSRDGRALEGLDVDAAFVALHGRFGEDGGVQRHLERLRIPYTGSGPEASRLALDKIAAKAAFRVASIETPEALTFDPPWDENAAAGLVAREIGFPCVVKPSREGSSIGVTIARDEQALREGLRAVRSLGPEAGEEADPALVERYVAGREFTVAVLEDRPLPAIELRPARSFYDFEAKYGDSGTRYILEVILPERQYREVQQAGVAAHRALGCEGCSRVDLILDAQGTPWVLEVNTIPGMTPKSLLPKAARAAGIEYGELCERLLQAALARACTVRAREVA